MHHVSKHTWKSPQVSLCTLTGLALLVFAPMTAAAETADSPVRFWPDVVDTVDIQTQAPDIEQAMLRGTGFSTYVPLGPTAPASLDLGDLLTRTTGIHVHRYGGLGSFSLASVRGSSPGQVQIYLDGVPISSASDGLVNLSTIPVSNLDHAEIYRGAQAVYLGGPAAAGTVSLVTPDALTTPLQFGVGAGSYGTYNVRGQWGATYDALGILLSTQYQTSDGNFSYLNRNGTPHNPDDDATVSRTNNGFSDLSYVGKLALDSGPLGWGDWGRFEYTSISTDRESGIPGTESLQSRSVSYESNRDRHQIRLRLEPEYPWADRSWGRPEFSGSLFIEKRRDLFDNRDGEVGIGRAHTEDETDRHGGQIALDLPFVMHGHRIRGLFYGDEEEFVPHDLLRDKTGFTRYRRNRSLQIGDEIGLFGESVLVHANYRWDRATDNYGGPVIFGRPPAPASERTSSFDAPNFGARWDLSQHVAIKGNRGEFIRFPTFGELFGDRGLQDGNPALVPEQGLQWDAGLLYQSGRLLRWELGYFESLVDDKIVLLQNSQRTVKAHNIGRTWSHGIESSIWLQIPTPNESRLELQSNLVWQEATDLGASPTYSGKALPNLPDLESYSSLEWIRTPWRVRYELMTRSSTYRDRYNSDAKETAGYAVHDLSGELALFRDRTTLILEIRNIGNKGVADIDGFPLPGRSTLAEVRFRF